MVGGGTPADPRDPALAQHHDAVGHLERMQDVVGDHDDGNAAALDLLDELEAAPGLGDARGGERLVQQHEPPAPVDEAAELDRLAPAA